MGLSTRSQGGNEGDGSKMPKAVSSTSSMETAASSHLHSAPSEGSSPDSHPVVQALGIVSEEPLMVLSQPPSAAALNTSLQTSTQPPPHHTTLMTHQAETTAAVPLVPRPPIVQLAPSSGMMLPAVIPNTNTVPEFLYQLTKMLTDNNRDIIEWSNGRIEVHNPHKLQTHVLNRYFRHSKFASFQRQLNYFGFRKLAGKGKMAPCSYINDATTRELGSLLQIKRKTGNEPKIQNGKKRERDEGSPRTQHIQPSNSAEQPVNPVLANILYRSSSATQLSANSNTAVGPAPGQSQRAIARVAVGKGIRHNVTISERPPLLIPGKGGPTAGSDIEAGLSALCDNYQSSLQEVEAAAAQSDQTNTASYADGYVPGSMRRDDSLVDLAMIPLLDDAQPPSSATPTGLTFIDFPWQDPNLPPTNAGD